MPGAPMLDTAVEKNSYSIEFADFVSQASFSQLTEKQVALLKDCLLDLVGVELVASTLPWNRLVYDYAVSEVGAFGPCTVIGAPKQLSALEAAFVNATFAQGCELDDFGH